eukprot:TRINITY_DN5687_c0_g1_i1.p1 TRINITY_DN5687_c0_g1~~TRINITY_DN5687_c0_g1_i1.p1  ORF type:complete len:926 (-),score=200.32 TRINITY_DN5687_c0_g1_i1:1175-3952(-)
MSLTPRRQRHSTGGNITTKTRRFRNSSLMVRRENKRTSTSLSPFLSVSRKIKQAKDEAKYIPIDCHINRSNHTSVIYRKRMWVFGGTSDGAIVNKLDLYTINKDDWETVELIDVEPRKDHTAVILKGKMYIFGGELPDGTVTNSFITLSKRGNCKILQAEPCPRKGHICELVSNKLYIFGGENENNEYLNDFWCYDISSKEWELLNLDNAPSPRSFSASSVKGTNVYVHGGFDGDNLSSFYEYDTRDRVWKKLPSFGLSPPPFVCGHSLSTIQNQFIVVGGKDQDSLNINSYDYQTNTWNEIRYIGEECSQRKHFSGCLYGTNIYVFGGNQDQAFSVLECGDLLGISDDINRDDWEALAMKHLPEVLSIKEKIRCINNELYPSYSLNGIVSLTDDRDKLSTRLLMRLVMEYLVTQGYHGTFNELQSVNDDIEYVSMDANGNGLLLLLNLAQRILGGTDPFSSEISKFKNNSEEDPRVEVLDHSNAWFIKNESEQGNFDMWEDDGLVINFEEDGNTVVSGSINGLVVHFLEAKDIKFKKLFLITFKRFMRPCTLLNKIIQRFFIPEERKSEDSSEDEKRILTSLNMWIKLIPSDFEDEELLDDFNTFLDIDLSRSGKIEYARKLGRSLRNCVAERQKYINRELFNYNEDFPPKEPIVPKNIFSTDLSLMDVSPIEIARQLTIRTYEIYSRIYSYELLNLGWLDRDFDKLCPNILDIEEIFHCVAIWVFNSIRESEGSAKTRAKLFERFCKMAEEFKNLQNFHLLFAVILGLISNNPMNKKTIAAIDSRTRNNFNENILPLIATDSDLYQSTIRKIVSENEKQPTIPFMHNILKKIETYKDIETDEDGNILIFNLRKTNNQIRKFQFFRKHEYNIVPVLQIDRLFETIFELPQNENTSFELMDIEDAGNLVSSILSNPQAKSGWKTT